MLATDLQTKVQAFIAVLTRIESVIVQKVGYLPIGKDVLKRLGITATRKDSVYAVNTIGRMGSGLWDVMSLNLDIPGNNEPLMKPDYVWEDKRE